MKKRFSEKHARMYMRQAREMASPEHNSCLSRSIGVVVVKPDLPGGRIVSTGFNGPAAGMPRPDSRDHLENVVWPQLSGQEREAFRKSAFARVAGDDKAAVRIRLLNDESGEQCIDRLAGCGECPRRLVGARSGERLELCSCSHAERNSIHRAAESLRGCTIFCWCTVPCWDCATAIVQSGIDHVVCLDLPDYSHHSRWIFFKSGVLLETRDPETLELSLDTIFNGDDHDQS